MPTRMLREGILTSERVNCLGLEAEVFYRRLMSVVDDYGRYHAHPSLLRAALFPLRLGSVEDHTMERLLAEVARAGVVRVYQVQGKRYVELQAFRQRVRAQGSKFPSPPDDGRMPAACPSSARPDAGVGEDVVKDEGAGGAGTPPPASAASATAGTPPAVDASAAPPVEKNQNPAGASPVHVQLAVRLREAGVNITSAHPLARAWAERGLSVEQALEAVALARMRKPLGRIPANYLAPIVDDMLNPGGVASSKAAGPPGWWSSEAATLAKGRVLGINARPGEAMAEYRARLSEEIARKGNAGQPANAQG